MTAEVHRLGSITRTPDGFVAICACGDSGCAEEWAVSHCESAS